MAGLCQDSVGALQSDAVSPKRHNRENRLMIRKCTFRLFVIALASISPGSPGLSAARTKKTNVLFLFTDDQRADTPNWPAFRSAATACCGSK